MRQAILVLGMHRSGTSALTRVLSLLGAALPKHLLGADKSNGAGHWEPKRLVHLHDAMLAEAGSRWDDWRAFDPATLGPGRLTHYKDEITRLVEEEYGSAPLIVIKDPRICRFVPLYQDILARIGFEPICILCLRHPLAVADSLTARDSMTGGHGLLLWLRHVLDSEFATRSSRRTFIEYEEIFDVPESFWPQAGRTIGITWPIANKDSTALIANALQRDMQHHAPKELNFKYEQIGKWVQECYRCLLALKHNPIEFTAQRSLDQIRNELIIAEHSTGRATWDERYSLQLQYYDIYRRSLKQAEELHAELKLKRSEIETYQSELNSIRHELDLAKQNAAYTNDAPNEISKNRSRRLTAPLQAALAKLCRIKQRP